MLQIDIFNENVEAYEAWYEKYPKVYFSEITAIKEQLLKLPENLRGIEVGLGTGRFSEPLGIKEGIEPSDEMLDIELTEKKLITKALERTGYNKSKAAGLLNISWQSLDRRLKKYGISDQS